MPPKKIPAQEVVKDIRSGMSEAEIALKYELSASQVVILHEMLFGADFLDMAEFDRYIGQSAQPDGPNGNNGKRSVEGAGLAAPEDSTNGNAHSLEKIGSGAGKLGERSAQEIQREITDKPKEFIDVSGQGRNRWWCYAASLVFVFLFATLAGIIAIGIWAPDIDFDNKTGHFVGMAPLEEFVLLNLTFALLLVGLFLAVRFEHKRPFLTLITAKKSIDWKLMGKSFCVFFGLLSVETVIGYLVDPSDLQFSFKPDRFFPFAAAALVLTPIQTSTEELLFRGYLLQMTALLTKNRYALVLIVGLAFGLLHLSNPEFETGGWPVAVTYCEVGCFLVIVTFKSNGLETALGMHAATNLFCCLIVGYPNSALESESIFRVLTGPGAESPFSFAVQAIIFYLIMFGGNGVWDRLSTLFSREGAPAVSS